MNSCWPTETQSLTNKGKPMPAKRKVTKKKTAKKKVAAVNRQAELVTKLRADVKSAKEEGREAAKKLRESQRQITALLKLLESTQAAAGKFLAKRVKEAVKQYGITTAPKKRRRQVAKKKAVPQKVSVSKTVETKDNDSTPA